MVDETVVERRKGPLAAVGALVQAAARADLHGRIDACEVEASYFGAVALAISGGKSTTAMASPTETAPFQDGASSTVAAE